MNDTLPCCCCFCLFVFFVLGCCCCCCCRCCWWCCCFVAVVDNDISVVVVVVVIVVVIVAVVVVVVVVVTVAAAVAVAVFSCYLLFSLIRYRILNWCLQSFSVHGGSLHDIAVDDDNDIAFVVFAVVSAVVGHSMGRITNEKRPFDADLVKQCNNNSNSNNSQQQQQQQHQFRLGAAN